MLTRYDIQKILKLLKSRVMPAVGCSEPMSVALAVAKAREMLGVRPEQISARLSGTIIKNAMGVGIPNSEGMVGIGAAMAMAAVTGNSEDQLDMFMHVSPEDVAKARSYMAEHRFTLKQAHGVFELIYVEIEAQAADHTAKVIIAKDFTHFVYLKLDEEVMLDERASLATEHDHNHESELTMEKIYEFSTKASLDELQFLLKGARMNKEVAQMAFAPDSNYGLNLGKMLRGGYEERMVGQNAMPRVVCYTCAACDVRMSGARVPFMTNSGSGNQGIAATIPVLIFAEEMLCTESKLVRALAISQLTNIYIQQLLGRLSSHCRCVLASAGAACGIAYLMGGSLEQVCMAAKNYVAGFTGMICDGAKPSCTLRLATAASSAFQSAMMSMEGICVSSNDGIVETSADKTLDNLALIGRDFKHEIDNMVLNIMIDKE